MNKFDDELRKALSENGTYDADRGREAARKAAAGFDSTLRKAERIAVIFQLSFSGLLAFSFIRLMMSDQIRETVYFGYMVAVSLIGLAVSNTWYWIVNAKVTVLKEVAALRIDLGIARQGEPPMSGAPVGKTDVTWFYFPFMARNKCRRRFYLAALILVAILAAWAGLFFDRWVPSAVFNFRAAWERVMAPAHPEREEMTEYHIHNAHEVRARSSIHLTDREEGLDTWRVTVSPMWLTDRGEGHHTLDLVFPYSNAEVTSITLDGAPVEWRQTAPGHVRVQLPSTPKQLARPTLHVEWTFPFADFKREKGGIYEMPLRSLKPVRSYSLRVTLDPGSGFVSMLNLSNPLERLAGCFSGTSRSGKPVRDFGSLGVMVRPQSAAPSPTSPENVPR